MSIPVHLESLRREVEGHGPVAFLLSGGSDGRPHCVQLAVSVVDSGWLQAHQPGRGTRANLVERPLVSILWPPTEPGGYSLIVDATAVRCAEDEPLVTLEPTRAVLHRPAQLVDPTAVAQYSDCVRIFKASR